MNLSVPLSVVGAGGVAAGSVAALNITVTGHAWTTGPAVVTYTAYIFPTGDVVLQETLTGYDSRIGGHGGALQLVSPMRVMTNAGGDVPAFMVMTLFVPEPGTGLLLFAAAGACLLAGHRRRRR